MVFDVREIVECQCKQKKIARRMYPYHCIKCRKPFLKFHYQKHIQGCIFGTFNSGGEDISKKLIFSTKENVLPSDKSSTPKVNQPLSKLKHKNVPQVN